MGEGDERRGTTPASVHDIEEAEDEAQVIRLDEPGEDDDGPQVIHLDEPAEKTPQGVRNRLAQLDDWTAGARPVVRRGPLTDRLARVDLDEDRGDAD